MAMPRFVVLKSNYNNKYLRYIQEDVSVHGYLQFSGDVVVSPYAKYEVEMAKIGKGLVHIRCCYNNKYWVRKSEKDNPWIVAEAHEAEEDKSKWSCTLFEPVYLDAAKTKVRFRHVQLGHYACLFRSSKRVENECVYAGWAEPNSDMCDVCTIINWESLLVLPKHVAFKGDNDKYLSARWVEGHQYLQFASNDIGDATVGNQVFITSNGNIRIKSDHFGKFWRRSPNWIWADSDDTSNKNSDTLFWPVKIDNNVVALRNLGNNSYCCRLTCEGKTSCLNASSSTICNEARLKVEELVLSRTIYNVDYRLLDARIYRQNVITMGTGTAVNRTQQTNTLDVKVSYSETQTTTWNASVSLKLGVKTTIVTGIPYILEGKIDVSGEVTTGFQWGETKSETKVLENVYKVTVPPMTKVTVSVVATKGSCDVPFSYSQLDTLINGQQITNSFDDGVFTGINCYNVKYETKQDKL